jgi:CheY-like chemotaxis protein
VQPALVLVDWFMRNIESLEFATRLSQEIVIVTRVVRPVVSQQGMRELQGARIAEADDQLMKPFTVFQIDEKPAKVGLACRL